MSKNTYSIINVANNEVLFTQTSFPLCRDICRDFLYQEENFGVRLQVVKNRTEENPGEVVFDVTNIKYSSGKVRMTLWKEYERQQKMHEATAAKAAAREAEKKAKAEAKAAAKAKAAEIVADAEDFKEPDQGEDYINKDLAVSML
jgi:hypothetical protein